MNLIRYFFFRDKLFEFGGVEPLIFSGCSCGVGVFFRIRCIDDEMMFFVDLVDFIVVCNGKMYCGGGVGGGGGVSGGGVGVGVGVGVDCVCVEYGYVVYIETCNTHIFAFQVL